MPSFPDEVDFLSTNDEVDFLSTKNLFISKSVNHKKN